MAERPATRPEMAPAVVPTVIGAVFKQGEIRSLVYDWPTQEYLRPDLDIADEQERRQWMFENIRAFSEGTVDPQNLWKGTIDLWRRDLKSAAKAVELEREIEREAERDIMAMMAISASARAMEASEGDTEAYLRFISGGSGEMGVQGTWREYLLHNDSEKLNRILRMPLVKSYYERLLADAGVVEVKEWEGKKPSHFKVDKVRAERGRMFRYLRSKGIDKYQGGFNEYISDVLLAGDTEEEREKLLERGFDDTCRLTAAKLACDAFLVDKFTRWEFEVDPEGKMVFRPSQNWDGDPFRTVLEPSFLPRRIKGMYPGKQAKVLDLLDSGFRPKDIFGRKEFREFGGEDNLVQASAVGHLKTLMRYNRALWTILGKSTQAEGLPQWNPKEEEPTLREAAGLLDMVYGILDKPRQNTGKEILGAMMARIIQSKALATAVEVGKPGFGDRIKLLFGKDEEWPFYAVGVSVWGPGAKAKQGLLASLAGGRMKFVFKGSYDAEERLKDAYDLISTANEATTRTAEAKLKRGVSTFLDWTEVAAALQELFT